MFLACFLASPEALRMALGTLQCKHVDARRALLMKAVAACSDLLLGLHCLPHRQGQKKSALSGHAGFLLSS